MISRSLLKCNYILNTKVKAFGRNGHVLRGDLIFRGFRTKLGEFEWTLSLKQMGNTKKF